MAKYQRIIEIMNKMNSSMSFQKLLATITDSAAELLSAEGASLLLRDKKSDELIFDVVVSDKGEIIKGKRIKIGVGIAGHVAKTGETTVVNDVMSDARFYSEIDASSGFSTKSAIAAPVQIHGKLIGVIEAVNSRNAQGFTSDDASTLRYLCDAAALSIQTHELVLSLKNRVAELTCIYEISQSIYFSENIPELLARVITAIKKVIRSERCSFVILDDDGESVKYFVSSTGENYEIKLKDSLIGHVIKTGDPLLVFDLENEDRYQPGINMGNYKSKSFICIPMKLNRKVIGVLNVTDKSESDTFDSFDLRVLSTISQQVAEMYDNVREYRDDIERRRIEHDLQIAAEIQRQSLTELPDKVNGMDMAGFIRPARYVGGDFFEVTEYNERFISVGVGDISGKGIPAAIFLSTVRNALRHEVIKNNMPESLFRNVNKWVCNESYNGMFCTFFYALIDREDKLIHYASAGHNPQIFFNTGEDRFME
ncbi:MAG TPA: GAF domain-containing protein, partial [Spirochaetota bacterium]|nr:GAF domain-containing protein [Spirochaetota bacterium]